MGGISNRTHPMGGISNRTHPMGGISNRTHLMGGISNRTHPMGGIFHCRIILYWGYKLSTGCLRLVCVYPVLRVLCLMDAPIAAGLVLHRVYISQPWRKISPWLRDRIGLSKLVDN